MILKKVCDFCGKEFEYPHWRRSTVKYCCRKCSDNAKKSTDLNCTCDVCGKRFHRKPFAVNRNGDKMGRYCSWECVRKAKALFMTGSQNHQYGLKGKLNASFSGDIIMARNHNLIERMVYVPNHPFASKNGRVKEHRLVVEQNYKLFDAKYFIQIEDNYYLLPNISVHHLDGNHTNNDISNLIPCTKSEHRKFHKTKILQRDSKGRILKTAVLKQGELLGSPEVDNQQPSQPLTKLEGSETRC